jgi:hypothetical protein
VTCSEAEHLRVPVIEHFTRRIPGGYWVWRNTVDMMQMTVEEAVGFFNDKKIATKLAAGYKSKRATDYWKVPVGS